MEIEIDFLLQPVLYYQQIVTNNIENEIDDYLTKSNEAIKQIIQDNYKQIPNFEMDLSQNYKLVKVRCMVQNIFDPEVFLGYHLEGKKYQNFAYQENIDEIDFQKVEQFGKLQERTPILSISIPGLNTWVQGNFKEPIVVKIYGDDAKNLKLNQIIDIVGVLYFPTLENQLNSQTEAEDFYSPSVDQLYPKSPVIHSFYTQNIVYLPFDMQKLFKITLLDQSQINGQQTLSNFNKRYYKFISLTQIFSQIISSSQHIQEISSDLQLQLKSPQDDQKNYSELFQIFEILTEDSHIAQFLIFYLVQASFQESKNGSIIGKMCMNISGCSEKLDHDQGNLSLGEIFHQIVQKLVIKSQYIPLSIKYLENNTFWPKQDDETRVIQPGVLQISDETHLIIDESQMDEGKLTVKGVQNIKAINDLIELQKLSFDFNYFQSQLDVNIPCIIFSAGNSFLACDFRIQQKFKKRCLPQKIYDLFLNKQENNDDYLNNLRLQILKWRNQIKKITLSKECQEQIEQEFVRLRKIPDVSNQMDENVLHKWIIFTKFLSAIKNEDQSTTVTFNEAKELLRPFLKLDI